MNFKFFPNFNLFCYKQTSPLGVPLYAFGFPKARESLALAQFVHSDSFFYPLKIESEKIFYILNDQVVYSELFFVHPNKIFRVGDCLYEKGGVVPWR